MSFDKKYHKEKKEHFVKSGAGMINIHAPLRYQIAHEDMVKRVAEKMNGSKKVPRASETVKGWAKELKHAGDLPKRKHVKWNV